MDRSRDTKCRTGTGDESFALAGQSQIHSADFCKTHQSTPRIFALAYARPQHFANADCTMRFPGGRAVLGLLTSRKTVVPAAVIGGLYAGYRLIKHYKVSTSPSAAAARALMTSSGWHSADLFCPRQHRLAHVTRQQVARWLYLYSI